jgi:hypothetical protein
MGKPPKKTGQAAKTTALKPRKSPKKAAGETRPEEKARSALDVGFPPLVPVGGPPSREVFTITATGAVSNRDALVRSDLPGTR